MKQINHTSLSEPIYESLKALIIKKELKPGEKLVQEKIALQLGVSRTPLMLALQRLEHEHLVERIPRRGMFVRDFSVKEMIEVYYCRESIECMAVRLATLRADKKDINNLNQLFVPFTKHEENINTEKYKLADEKFHFTIIELSKNTILQKMSKLSQVLSMVNSLGLLRSPQDTLAEHISIIKAMQEGDAEKAELLMKEHIRLSMKLLQDLNTKNTSE